MSLSTPRFTLRPLPHLIGALLLGLSMQASLAANLDLPSQPLGQALTEVARQSGVQVLFSDALTAGKTAAALKGNLAPAEALRRLLGGSGLQLRQQDGKTFVIERQVSNTSAAESTLENITVTASQSAPEDVLGTVKGYVARQSRTATKTATAISNTAQAITVASSEQISDQQAKSLAEVLRYMPGVQADGWGSDSRFETFNMRGFEAGPAKGLYRDGLAQHAYSFNGWRNEPYGLERVEVLRGPNSVLYGQANPGGLVNAVSKRPDADAAQEIAVTLGSFSRQQLAADVGGELSDTLSYRLLGVLRDSDTQSDFVYDDRQYLAPSFRWQPSAATSLTVLAQWQKDRSGGNAYMPIAGSLQANPFGKLPIGFNPGEAANRFDSQQNALGYEFSHAFNDSWTLRQNARYGQIKLDYLSVYGTGLDADQRTITRNDFRVAEKSSSLSADTQLQWQWRGTGLTSTTLLGFDYLRDTLDGVRRWGSAPSIDAFNPQYGQPLTMADPYHDQRSVMNQHGLYLQNQLALANGWHSLLALRHDRAKTVNDDRLNRTHSEELASATTGRAGVLYRFANGLAPYLSYSESFSPVSGKNYSGTPFVPETAKQWEAGFKLGPENGDWRVALALFDLNKHNVKTKDPNPAHPDGEVQQGQVRSRGAELELQSRLGQQWQVTANYSYAPAKVVKSFNGDEGKMPTLVQKHLASGWVDYRTGQWQLGAGVRYLGSSFVDAANTLSIPAATLLDAGISYQLQHWSAALNVQNLLGKKYIAACFEGSGCNYGTQRNVQLTGRYRW